MQLKRETTGITRRKVGEFLVVEVDVKKAVFKGKPYRNLDFVERKNYDDLLYLSNIQLGNVKICYV